MILECSQIQADELEVFVKLIQAVNDDLEQQLWKPDQLTPARLLQDYGLESMYLGRINGQAIASFVLLENDPDFWPNVIENESLFIHKVVVARAWKGQNRSQQILDFAAQQVLARGKKFLRLDTDATRPALCNLYEKYGFTRVGEGKFGRFQMALYELEVRG
jgi:GNAT superfamily N-acetyltransferase